MIGNVRNRVSVLFDFGRRQFSGDAARLLPALGKRRSRNHCIDCNRVLLKQARRELRTRGEVCHLQLPCFLL